MKIYDTVMFLNEYDLLELRLREHYDHVDKFVIVECDRTYSGIYKGFNLEKHLDRYSQWMDKIDYIKVENSPTDSNAWVNEEWQRNQQVRGWKDLTDNDVILISDMDEITRGEALQYIRDTDYSFYGLAMPMFYFKYNYMDVTDNYPWRGKAYRGFQAAPFSMRFKMDEVPGQNKIELHHAGWHFSYLGNEEFIKNKINSFSHQELNIPSIVDKINVSDMISRGRDYFRPDEVWEPVILDEYFPKTILNNISKYRDFIAPGGKKTVQEYWPWGILEENLGTAPHFNNWVK
jgi:hypothetical protein